MIRNRSQGWQHAKISGHLFEDEFLKEILKGNSAIRISLNCFLKGKNIKSYPIQGDSQIGKKKFNGIFGKKTTPKTDVIVLLNDNKKLKISIKKPSSNSGQLHLSIYQSFMDCIEHYIGFANEKERKDIDWVFRAFTGNTGGKKIFCFANKARPLGPIIKKHDEYAEIYQNRLYASTIREFYFDEWEVFSNYFKTNFIKITKILFSMGYCSDPSLFADIIYYGCSNLFYKIADMASYSKNFQIEPSPNGYYKGSTINMPWGFLQVHRPGKHEGPYQLQFHHNHSLVNQLFNS